MSKIYVLVKSQHHFMAHNQWNGKLSGFQNYVGKLIVLKCSTVNFEERLDDVKGRQLRLERCDGFPGCQFGQREREMCRECWEDAEASDPGVEGPQQGQEDWKGHQKSKHLAGEERRKAQLQLESSGPSQKRKVEKEFSCSWPAWMRRNCLHQIPGRSGPIGGRPNGRYSWGGSLAPPNELH